MTETQTNIVEFTVSELSFALKRTVENAYERVRVRGEISGFRGRHGSGHCYFTLKDEGACLEAVVWRSAWEKLRFKPEEGLEMVATGRLTTYPRQSKYQIVVESLEPAGAGALMALLEERRRRLAAEGLFDEGRKRPLPFLPKVIGIVTSPTGAVIRDMLHRLRDRFPRHALVWPARVQGDGAAEEVAAALHGFNALEPGGQVPRPDLLIVARGGGSIEDLWAFNEEVLVRAVAASAIPVVSAVGHETDWTLCDFAADVRAPTPTAAAEMAVPVRAELLAAVSNLAGRHELAVARAVERRRRELALAARALPALSDLLALPRQRLDEASGRLKRSLVAAARLKRRHFDGVAARLSAELLRRGQARQRERLADVTRRLEHGLRSAILLKRRPFDAVTARLSADLPRRSHVRQAERLANLTAQAARALGQHLDRQRRTLENATRLLNSLSHQSALARGFALVWDEQKHLVRARAAVRPGHRLELEFVDGRVPVTAGGAPAGRKPPRGTPSPEDQGALF